MFTGKSFNRFLQAFQIQASVLGRFSSTIVRESWSTSETKDKINALKKAFNLLDQCKGKIVVTSMGRFGQVSQLVASTFSAVGTESIFLHSAEAVNGDDLLQVHDDDLLLVISKSGNKTDIVKLASLCRARGIKVVSICDTGQSALGSESDVVVELGDSYSELDVGGVTPTTSVELVIALCNSFAVGLYYSKKTQGDKVLEERHPSSEFGTKEVSKVRDVMIEIVPVEKGSTFEEINSVLSDSCRDVVFVRDSDQIVGQITGKDISKAMSTNDSKTKLFTSSTAEDIMNTDLRSVSEDSLVADALEVMKLNKSTTVLVESDKPGFYVVDFHSV